MKEINFLFEQSYMQGKRIAPSRTQTCTSHSLDKHPNHLDHLHYTLYPCLNSSLRVYCLIQDLDIGVHCHLAVTYSLEEHLHMCIAHFLDNAHAH